MDCFFVGDSRNLRCAAERNSCPINSSGPDSRDCDRRSVFSVVTSSGTQAERHCSVSRGVFKTDDEQAAARVANAFCRSGIVWIAGGKHRGAFGHSVFTVDGSPSDRVADVACVDSFSRAAGSRADDAVASFSQFRVEPPVDVAQGVRRPDPSQERRTTAMVVRVSTVVSRRSGTVLLEPREPDCRSVTLPADDSVVEFRRKHRSAAGPPLQIHPPGPNGDLVDNGFVVGDCSLGADRPCGMRGSENLHAYVEPRSGKNVVRERFCFVVNG